jgi:hypothetical protein
MRMAGGCHQRTGWGFRRPGARMSKRPVDFLSEPRPPLLGWLLLGIGLTALASALWCQQRWSDIDAALLSTRAAIDAENALPAPQVRREPSLAQRRWEQAQGELQHPWLATLRTIEGSTTDPVFLLSLTIEPAKGVVRLDAEAPNFERALDYVQILDIDGTLQPAQLLSHEKAVDASGGKGTVKFSVLTHWIAPKGRS